MSKKSESLAADRAVELFLVALTQAIDLEISHSRDVAHIPGLIRALSIVKEVWQQ